MNAKLASTSTALALALLLGSCPDPPGAAEHVSDNPRLQAAYVTLRRGVDEIKRRKKRGEDIYGDCQAMKMLLGKQLKGSNQSAVKRTIDELHKACQGARAY